MGEDVAGSYDALPYRGSFIPMTHPDRMAVMAVLHGMEPPPIETARVLELGCTDGGNLLTIAQSLPRASLLGVDISPRQVAEGQGALRKLGVDNVELRTLDLARIDDSFGLFDYIICHGVYSWVTSPVRDKILEICCRNLAPRGVAYISYNTYPGWHSRMMIREMMLYHTQGISDPTQRVQQARAVLDFASRASLPENSPHAQYLRDEATRLERFADTYLFHDYLAEENHPVYFHEFAEHAVAAGLRYLNEATFGNEEMRLSADARQVLSRLGPDVIRREQYTDFVLNRAFRQSLLCHAGLLTFDRPSPEAIGSLRLVAMARPENASPDLLSDAREPFRTFHGDTLTVNEPLLKAALLALYELWPASASFEELWTATLKLLGRSETKAPADSSEFATKLLLGHMVRLLNLHTYDPPIATEPGERPRAGALARRNAAAGSRVVSLRNHNAALEEIDRLILPLLDGTRDRAAIIDDLASEVAAGNLKLKSDHDPIDKPAAVRKALEQTVKLSLQRIACQALLMQAS
jgi:methyltransferase-like protein/cyclopropane fatty-acyl-phospholipid synthase-like methyltransferase